jgi:hypothetical protein
VARRRLIACEKPNCPDHHGAPIWSRLAFEDQIAVTRHCRTPGRPPASTSRNGSGSMRRLASYRPNPSDPPQVTRGARDQLREAPTLVHVGTRCGQRPRQTSAPAARETSRSRSSRPRQRRSAQALRQGRWPAPPSARSPACRRLNARWASVSRSLVDGRRPTHANAHAAWPCPEPPRAAAGCRHSRMGGVAAGRPGDRLARPAPVRAARSAGSMTTGPDLLASVRTCLWSGPGQCQDARSIADTLVTISSATSCGSTPQVTEGCGSEAERLPLG